MARNAGLADYRALVWEQYGRFDYSPEQCLAFADAIEKTCVPLVTELYRGRAGERGLGGLRGWGTDVDPAGREGVVRFGGGGGDVLERYLGEGVPREMGGEAGVG